MNQHHSNVLRLLYFLFAASISFSAAAQGTQVKKTGVIINGNCHGYLEYLPPGYNATGPQRYPLLIFFGGNGSQGPGTTTSLDQFFTGSGTPADQCQNGSWVPSYTVNGQTFSFIVITPQFIRPFCCEAIPTPSEVDDVINYMIQNYNVDESRIYLTGISSGAAIPFEYTSAGSNYANKIAAIVTFATTSWGNQSKANVLRAANLPVWGFHNLLDVNPPPIFTQNWIDLINTPAPSTPPAKGTYFPNVASHDCWYAAYTRAHTEDGMNIYEWMLQYSRPAMASPLPVKFSLFNQHCVNNKVQLTWKTEMEMNVQNFSVEKSKDGRSWYLVATVDAKGNDNGAQYEYLDANSGAQFYRVVANDVDGQRTFSSILRVGCNDRSGVTILPNPSKGPLSLSIRASVAETASVIVFDNKGSVVHRQQQQLMAGTNQFDLELGTLAAGMYSVRVERGGQVETVSFMKQ